MKIVVAPEKPDLDEHYDRPYLFLAGGITNCDEWQDEVCEKLSDDSIVGTVFNPRRKNFPMGDPEAGKKQIAWEYWALNDLNPDIISFWFDGGESLQPITLYELGRYSTKHMLKGSPEHLVVASDPNYGRDMDVREQLKHSGCGNVGRSLAQMIDEIKLTVNKYLSENG
jgi:hypothetical protein